MKWLGSGILQGINTTTGTIGIFSELPLELILSSRSNTGATLGSENGFPKNPSAQRIHVPLLTIKTNTP